ncbi:MAG: HlyD family efflux transporter periplasmic adaptor subunit, partial [Alphaproteobacteria bacterium]|nr:HlyD family efflux transporter periplasmic adaptor subunit [Alphaproteobacteria bacterium]
ATIVDMETLEAVVEVSESNIGLVRAGQSATATLNAYPDWQIPATVIGRIPTADEAKGTVKVRVALSVHGDERILPQMGVRVSFLTGRESVSGVTIPADAVLVKGDDGAVFVIGADGKAHRRIVRLASHTADGVVVLSGLRARERVAAGDLSRIHDGMSVGAAN